jgi:hypothetical protein
MSVPTWRDTFLDLHSASTVDELWSTLLAWHGIRSSTQWEEPFILFRRFHAENPEGAVVTAALLCTDQRWRKASHHLVVRLVESGVLTDADQHQLAEWFVEASLGIHLAAEVIDVPEVVRDTEPHRRDAEEPRRPDDGAEIVVVSRDIWPPLRRWAAARLVREDPSRWRALLDSTTDLSSSDAAALAAGVMDAAQNIPNDERVLAVAAGLDSGSGIVRLAALPALAALEGADTALTRAAADPSAKVRAWTPTAPAAHGTKSHSTLADDDGEADRAGANATTRQRSMF